MLKDAESGHSIAVTSAMTITEVTGGRGRPLHTATRDVIRSFFENDWIMLVETDRFVAELARDLIWDHPTLRSMDAIHLASAIKAGCDVLFTYDENHPLSLPPRSDIRVERPVFTREVQEPPPEPDPSND